MQILVPICTNSERFYKRLPGAQKLALRNGLNMAHLCKFAFCFWINLQFELNLAKRPVCAYAQTGNGCTKTAYLKCLYSC